MSDETKVLIGRLTDVRGNGMEAMILQEYANAAPLLKIGDEEFLAGQLGSYVVIQQTAIRILALVFKMEEKEHFGSHGERWVCRSISLIPVGEIGENGAFSRGVRHYPTPGAGVYAVGIGEINAAFSKFRAYRFNVGSLSTHKTYSVSLDPSVLFGRHFAILGQSGAGKSWTVASLIQRAVTAMPKAHVILLDLHGEYCWQGKDGMRHSAFDEKIMRYVDAQELEIPYWLMTFAELCDLFIDKSDRGATVQTAFMREVIHALKKRSAKEIGLETVSIDTPVHFSLIDLYRQFKDANEERKDFGKIQGALYGQFDEFLVKMQSRLNDVRYDFLLKPKRRNHSNTLSGLLRDFVGLGEPKCQVTIIDLSGVPFDVRPAVSAQIGRLAFEFNYWNPKNREFPILLVCEEAHAYIPRESGSQFEGTRKSMERIAKEGRKYGVGLGVVSQRPHELSETVLAQCSTFICMRITNPDDQAYVRDLIPEAEGDLVDILTSMGRGEAIILGEAAPLPTRVQFYRPDPEPNSNDADYFTHWRSGPDDLDVDAIVDRWRRQGRLSAAGNVKGDE